MVCVCVFKRPCFLGETLLRSIIDWFALRAKFLHYRVTSCDVLMEITDNRVPSVLSRFVYVADVKPQVHFKFVITPRGMESQ